MAVVMALPFIGVVLQFCRARMHGFAKRMMARVWRIR